MCKIFFFDEYSNNSCFHAIVKISVSGQTISVDVVPLVGSFIIALVIGILTIKLMLKLTQKLNFKFFSIYLFVMAIISAIVIW